MKYYIYVSATKAKWGWEFWKEAYDAKHAESLLKIAQIKFNFAKICQVEQ